MKTQAQQEDHINHMTQIGKSKKMLIDAITSFESGSDFVSVLKNVIDNLEETTAGPKLSDGDCISLEHYFGRKPSDRLRKGRR